MNANPTRRYRWITPPFTFVLALAFGCGGGGAGTSGITGTFMGSGTAATANLVRLRASTTDKDLVGIEVAIGGVTTSTDLYAFAFDIVLSDDTVAKYVANSASFGSALTLTGSQTSNVQVSEVGNHLIIGATKLGGGMGNRVPADESAVLGFSLQVLKAGTTTLTFAGSSSPQNPTNDPAALDHDLNIVTSVHFDAAPASLVGR